MADTSRMKLLLYVTVFLIATCGLVYELVAGTVASYLLGDSVTQFSLVIGVYLSAMGVGAFLSKYIHRNLLQWFIRVELLVGLVGGISSALLFYLFEAAPFFDLYLFLLVFLTGMFVGVELPLLIRILKDQEEFKDLVSSIFTLDYIGALLASLIFPFLLMPSIGLLKTSFLFGILNTIVGVMLIEYFRALLPSYRTLMVTAIFQLVFLSVGFAIADRIQGFTEELAFDATIVHAESTPYQRIVVTRNKDDIRLFLNSNLQFSSRDEYRYHEALVHPAFASARHHDQVLVLGGGDGLAVREMLKYPDVKSITLVDLDPAMTTLFKSNVLMKKLNNGSLSHPKVNVINADAFSWLRSSKQLFDVVVIDFPDPSGYSVGKLYTSSFYHTLRQVLSPEAVIVVQSTSPLVAPNSFWCVNNTIRSCGFKTIPYHSYVPSFGEWGFVLASMQDFPVNEKPVFIPGLRYFATDVWAQMKFFPADMQYRDTPVNRLNNQQLVLFFEQEWSKVM